MDGADAGQVTPPGTGLRAGGAGGCPFSGERFEELQTVAVGVFAVKATHPREVIVKGNGVSGLVQPPGPAGEVTDQDARVRLPCRPEVGLNAEVQLDVVATEPAAATGGESGSSSGSNAHEQAGWPEDRHQARATPAFLHDRK
ncbi:hypothetical protein ABZV14_31600 [Streptosporangium canum]|uniref:hypothetical protein n=1 Tax=Streptosporangium canum TaxID=324952 RepID=UPI0033ADF40B